jgi:hypothetical protein
MLEFMKIDGKCNPGVTLEGDARYNYDEDEAANKFHERKYSILDVA